MSILIGGKGSWETCGISNSEFLITSKAFSQFLGQKNVFSFIYSGVNEVGGEDFIFEVDSDPFQIEWKDAGTPSGRLVGTTAIFSKFDFPSNVPIFGIDLFSGLDLALRFSMLVESGNLILRSESKYDEAEDELISNSTFVDNQIIGSWDDIKSNGVAKINVTFSETSDGYALAINIESNSDLFSIFYEIEYDGPTIDDYKFKTGGYEAELGTTILIEGLVNNALIEISDLNSDRRKVGYFNNYRTSYKESLSFVVPKSFPGIPTYDFWEISVFNSLVDPPIYSTVVSSGNKFRFSLPFYDIGVKSTNKKISCTHTNRSLDIFNRGVKTRGDAQAIFVNRNRQKIQEDYSSGDKIYIRCINSGLIRKNETDNFFSSPEVLISNEYLSEGASTPSRIDESYDHLFCNTYQTNQVICDEEENYYILSSKVLNLPDSDESLFYFIGHPKSRELAVDRDAFGSFSMYCVRYNRVTGEKEQVVDMTEDFRVTSPMFEGLNANHLQDYPDAYISFKIVCGGEIEHIVDLDTLETEKFRRLYAIFYDPKVYAEDPTQGDAVTLNPVSLRVLVSDDRGQTWRSSLFSNAESRNLLVTLKNMSNTVFNEIIWNFDVESDESKLVFTVSFANIEEPDTNCLYLKNSADQVFTFILKEPFASSAVDVLNPKSGVQILSNRIQPSFVSLVFPKMLAGLLVSEGYNGNYSKNTVFFDRKRKRFWMTVVQNQDEYEVDLGGTGEIRKNRFSTAYIFTSRDGYNWAPFLMPNAIISRYRSFTPYIFSSENLFNGGYVEFEPGSILDTPMMNRDRKLALSGSFVSGFEIDFLSVVHHDDGFVYLFTEVKNEKRIVMIRIPPDLVQKNLSASNVNIEGMSYDAGEKSTHSNRARVISYSFNENLMNSMEYYRIHNHFYAGYSNFSLQEVIIQDSPYANARASFGLQSPYCCYLGDRLILCASSMMTNIYNASLDYDADELLSYCSSVISLGYRKETFGSKMPYQYSTIGNQLFSEDLIDTDQSNVYAIHRIQNLSNVDFTDEGIKLNYTTGFTAINYNFGKQTNIRFFRDRNQPTFDSFNGWMNRGANKVLFKFDPAGLSIGSGATLSILAGDRERASMADFSVVVEVFSNDYTVKLVEQVAPSVIAEYNYSDAVGDFISQAGDRIPPYDSTINLDDYIICVEVFFRNSRQVDYTLENASFSIPESVTEMPYTRVTLDDKFEVMIFTWIEKKNSTEVLSERFHTKYPIIERVLMDKEEYLEPPESDDWSNDIHFVVTPLIIDQSGIVSAENGDSYIIKQISVGRDSEEYIFNQRSDSSLMYAVGNVGVPISFNDQSIKMDGEIEMNFLGTRINRSDEFIFAIELYHYAERLNDESDGVGLRISADAIDPKVIIENDGGEANLSINPEVTYKTHSWGNFNKLIAKGCNFTDFTLDIFDDSNSLIYSKEISLINHHTHAFFSPGAFTLTAPLQSYGVQPMALNEVVQESRVLVVDYIGNSIVEVQIESYEVSDNSIIMYSSNSHSFEEDRPYVLVFCSRDIHFRLPEFLSKLIKTKCEISPRDLGPIPYSQISDVCSGLPGNNFDYPFIEMIDDFFEFISLDLFDSINLSREGGEQSSEILFTGNRFRGESGNTVIGKSIRATRDISFDFPQLTNERSREVIRKLSFVSKGRYIWITNVLDDRDVIRGVISTPLRLQADTESYYTDSRGNVRNTKSISFAAEETEE